MDSADRKSPSNRIYQRIRQIQAAIDNLQQQVIFLLQDWENQQESQHTESALTRQFDALASPSSTPAADDSQRARFSRKWGELTPQQREGLEESMRSPDLKRHDMKQTPKRRIVPTHVGGAGSSSSHPIHVLSTPPSSSASSSAPSSTGSDYKNNCQDCGVDMGKNNPRQLCGKTVCYNPTSPVSTPSSCSEPETATPSPSNINYWREREKEWHNHRNKQIASQESFSTLAERAKVRANELFEAGFERRRGEKMKHWVTRIIEGIDAGELPFMNPEALRKILISVPDFDATEEEIASANSFIETANLEPLYTLLSELEYHLENTKSDVTEDAFASGFSYKSKGHRRENVRAWVKRLANSIAQGKNPFKTLDGLENVFTRVGRVKAGGATPTRKELVDAMNNPQQLRRLFQRLSDFLGDSGGSTNLRL
jgi:hypothetical protein